jgi:asparagine synthase (glutamine-hydrolysing)|tara:strand:- start:1683 stop:2903 length:1221 start_codon:yes stop_codon:yes gene_type:complete
VDSLKNKNLSFDKISNILTLRYDPNNQSTLKKINGNDFLPKSSVNLNKIKDILKNSIQTKLNSQSNLTVALSGGVDSTLLLSLTKELFPDIHITAITITFPYSDDESESAANIAHHFDIDHKIIHVDNFLKELPTAISILKEPYYDVMNWYYLVKNTSSASNILLTGDGADEIFGGYTFRYSKFLEKITDNSSPIEKVKAYLECHERDWVPDQENIFEKKLGFSWNKIYDTLEPFFNNNLSTLDQLFLADSNGKLMHNFVPNYKKFYDFFQISYVSPFLDKSVIEHGLHLHPEEKYDSSNNIGKLPLRSLLSKDVYSLLFPKLKQGFAVNTSSLWDSYGKEICKQYLFDSRIVKDGWISEEWIQKNFQKADSDKNIRYINKFFSLLAYEVWYRLFITKEMSSSETL